MSCGLTAKSVLKGIVHIIFARLKSSSGSPIEAGMNGSCIPLQDESSFCLKGKISSDIEKVIYLPYFSTVFFF